MKSIFLNLRQKKPSTHLTCTLLLSLMFMGCISNKKIKQKTILAGSDQNALQTNSDTGSAVHEEQAYGFDDHQLIRGNSDPKIPLLPSTADSLRTQLTTPEENEIIAKAVLVEEFANPNILDISSPVADRIVENYLNSDNKEPGGHCLSVSKDRFEKAYKEIYGHPLYQDLPGSMGSKFYTPKEVFNFLYVSASGTHSGWRSLPETYRGKGNAGAIAYAGMGTLVDSTGVWSGQLRPGALMQVWRFKDDYEEVVRGVNVKKLDPYGHSFIFIGYVRDEKKEIIGLKIADQGFQSYRPLRPRDYQVWWAVNLSI